MCEVSAGVGLAVSAVGMLAAAVAAIFAGCQLRASRRATQVQVFDATFKELRALEDRYSAKNPKSNSADERNWCSGFFNTLEYMSFLVNEGLIPRKPFIHFYRDAIINWYDTIFLNKSTADQKTDPRRFPELKKLYKRLK